MRTLRLWPIVFTLFFYSSVGFARTVVISDIDDTIKKSNSMGALGGAWYFFLKRPYVEMRDLYNELEEYEKGQGQEIAYYYVSAAPTYIFDGIEWIYLHRFPKGEVFLRSVSNGGNTYEFKARVIREILQKELRKDPQSKVIFFGDNAAYDPLVYSDLAQELKLVSPSFFVRDVSTEATYFSPRLPVRKMQGITYFFSERELIDNAFFSFMSETLKSTIKENYEKGTLVPHYTLTTLIERLKLLCDELATEDRCKDEAKKEAKAYWKDYHHRF